MKFDQFTLSSSPLGNVFVVGYTADGSDNLRLTAASLPISTATQTALNLKEPITVYKDANFTAVVGTSYNVNDTDAGITVTSPSGTEGDWFDVFVQGGSVTVGGTAYTDGITIKAHFVGGGWEYNAIYPASGPFGTAATRDVGQASGNVLELSAGGTVTLGNNTTSAGTIILKSGSASADVSIRNDDGGAVIGDFTIYSNFPVSFGSGVLTGARDYALPDASGTIALTADLSALNASNLTSGTVALARLPTITVATGGTGATTLTANNVILGNGTSAVQFVAPGTSGNVLTSNGTTWTSAAASGGGVPTSRTISTTAPLTGGGDLSANRTLAISDATTSTSGAVTLATTALSVAGTSTSTVLTPALFTQALNALSTFQISPDQISSGGVAGNGAVSNVSFGGTYFSATSGSALSYAYRTISSSIVLSGDGGAVNFNKTVGFSVTFEARATSTNSVIVFSFTGQTVGANAVGTVARLTQKGIGFEVRNTTVYRVVHDGTTKTATSTGLTVNVLNATPFGRGNVVTCIRTGSGTYQFWVNGVDGGTSTGGPTGLSSTQWSNDYMAPWIALDCGGDTSALGVFWRNIRLLQQQ